MVAHEESLGEGKYPSGVSNDASSCPLSHGVVHGRISDGGWLNFVWPFSLSSMLKYRADTGFVEFSLIVLHDPDFYYISFDFFQLDPSIEIDFIIRCQFGTYSFNFRIDF